MSTSRVVVIGASAAGLKAAARYRRLCPEAEITVIDQRDFISYGACGLPFFLAGDVDSIDQLRRTQWQALRDPDFFARVKGLEVRTGWRVTRLDPAAHELHCERGEGVELLNYDKLVIATGARPFTLPDISLGEAVSCFHTSEDALPLRQGLETGQVGSAAVVGGGFIGVEVAVALADMWGCEVTLLEAQNRLLPYLLDEDMAALVSAELRRHDVTVHLQAPVRSVATVDGQAEVVYGEGEAETLHADRAVVALGVKPAVGFAAEAGLQLGDHGGLVVDAQMRTSDPDIFAAGDCVEVLQRLTRQPIYLPLGSLANRQGRVVGDNLARSETRAELSSFPPVVGSACVKVFAQNVAATGLTEEAATRAGLSVRSVWGSFVDAAHYHPDHGALYLKLIYEAGTGRLLGLQGVGSGAVDKRVDVFATLLQRDGNLRDLRDLEFCYAPPYNAALDPLHDLACAALNREEAGLEVVGPFSEADGRLVIDVRSADEMEANPAGLPDTLHLPSEELRARVAEIPRDRPLLVVCEKGPRSAEVARWLLAQGFGEVVYLAGGAGMRAQAAAG